MTVIHSHGSEKKIFSYGTEEPGHRVDRVSGFFSSRPNWDSPTPHLQAGECVPPRDIQRLPTIPFSLVLRKEYFTVHRETLTQYISFKRGLREEPVILQL